MRRRLIAVCIILWLMTILLLTARGTAQAAKRATPPTSKELVGVWIGFDQDELTFTRLDLRADSSGYCARISPADNILHGYGVQTYRVKKWNISGWNVTIDLEPISSNAEKIYLKGRAGMESLKLEIAGAKGNWKMELLLYPESRIETSNQETKRAIDAAQN